MSYCKESERQHLENDSIERYYMLKERYLQPRFDEVRVGDNALKLYRDGYELYAAMLAAIDEQTILLTNASFVPDHSVLEALTAAVGRGVDVRILVPWQSRHNLANKVTCSSFTQCLQAGMHLYISRQSGLRSKTCTIDGQWSTIGSAHLDLLSSVVNYELNIEMYDVAFAAQMQDLFASDIADAHELTLQSG
jgi:cardiolipin synthase